MINKNLLYMMCHIFRVIVTFRVQALQSGWCTWKIFSTGTRCGIKLVRSYVRSVKSWKIVHDRLVRRPGMASWWCHRGNTTKLVIEAGALFIEVTDLNWSVYSHGQEACALPQMRERSGSCSEESCNAQSDNRSSMTPARQLIPT